MKGSKVLEVTLRFRTLSKKWIVANYELSAYAQADLVGIYKYGIKNFGTGPAVDYLRKLEAFLLELSTRPELEKDASALAVNLKFYQFKAHVIFYVRDDSDSIYVVRVLGKRMNFIEHL